MSQADRLPGGGGPNLLFLDAYDSFTNNITCLLRDTLQARLTTIKIDDARFIHSGEHHFHAFVDSFDGIIIGPGPGDPHQAKDIGLISKVWTRPEEQQTPVLGICLGFQSLIPTHGGKVERLNDPRHGIIRPVSHRQGSLFSGIGQVLATQYHSLHGILGHDLSSPKSDAIWQPSLSCPELLPLAWDFSDDRNGPVLMAVKHIKKPYWGVQYHPESICTNTEGSKVIQNWWREAQSWKSSQVREAPAKRRRVSPVGGGVDSGYGTETETAPATPEHVHGDTAGVRPSKDVGGRRSGFGARVPPESQVGWRCVDFDRDHDCLTRLCDLAKAETGRSPVLLESGTKKGRPVRPETGRFSIIGLVEQGAERFEYWTTSQRYRRTSGDIVEEEDEADVSNVFDRLQDWITDHRSTDGPLEVPFWGGLVGYVSYEAGLETIDVKPPESAGMHADVHFVSISRSMVVDHIERRLYVQTLRQDDQSWLDEMVETVRDQMHRVKINVIDLAMDQSLWKSSVRTPDENSYCEKVKSCQSHIRAGDSYELCLTQQSPIVFFEGNHHREPSPWQLYQRLRKINPAPFGAFLETEDLAIMSSSPERFLSWSRDGLCEFRPIKGTVQKGPGMTKEKAEAILKTEKEQAENLMIVDLIRHDLNGALGECGGSAVVPKLMQVEEYETVYQLVSVIQGELNLPNPLSIRVPAQDVAEHTESRLSGRNMFWRGDGEKTGVDVLRASLPPGSMTGAPKKRSCELLQQVEEGKPRGVYSGVLGYLDAGGGGDFSVVIRSVMRYEQGWRIGAGGAVTSLSDPVAEWEEMMAKLEAVQLS